MSFVPAMQSVPPGVATLNDYAEHARRALDAPAWAYLDGGAADEITRRDNEQAWQQLRLLPRVLRPMAGGHTRVQLLGRTLEHPLLVAPMAFQKLAHPEGELAVACAAAAQQAGLVASTQASIDLESIAKAFADEPGRGPLWFQLYAQDTRDATLELVRRAEAAGYEALVLTVDAPVHGARDGERRTGFRLPPGVRAVNLPPARVPQGANLFERLANAPTWDEVEWLAANTRLPLLLKGVVHPEDARQGIAAGAAGIIVSNHGGRTLDTMPATARLLPAIVREVAGQVPVLVDGGIRRGTDVLKAMALGADAVLVGRPILWALASAGAVGVAHVLRLLRDELEIAMALCGCPTLAEAAQVLAPENQTR
ncbi:MAG: alpha-hydroxy acid oxidase [Pseudomonadota bacterium]